MKSEKIKIFIREVMLFAPDVRKNFMNFPVCAGFKLSPHQFFCLINIYKSGPLSMSGLAQKLGVSNQQLTRIIDSLVENDLVIRFTDPLNRRIVLTKISENGKEILMKVEGSIQKSIAQGLEILTEEEIDACLTHVRALKTILSKVISSSSNICE